MTRSCYPISTGVVLVRRTEVTKRADFKEFEAEYHTADFPIEKLDTVMCLVHENTHIAIAWIIRQAYENSFAYPSDGCRTDNASCC